MMIRSPHLAAPLALALLAAPAAAQDSAQGAAQPEPGNTAAWLNSQSAFLAGLSFVDGWRPLQGGLMWRYISYAGSSEKPLVSDTVTVHYEGKLTNGTVFDSSYKRGEPATFPLFGLIRAWQLAIPQMGVGDVIEIAAPADLAYGSRGQGPIPPESVLVFRIELLGIRGR